MRTFALLAVTFVALIVFAATQESNQHWTISVGDENGIVAGSPLPDIHINSDDISAANDDDAELVDADEGDDADDADDEDDADDADDANDEASSEVLRRNRRDAAGKVCGRTYNFVRAQKLAVVRAHNRVRARQGASDMMRVYWSSRLARRAHDWASQCTWKHGLLNDCNGAPIGQNLYMAMNGRYFPTVNITNVVINGWSAEKKFYNYATTKCRPNTMCGHYTQVAWAKSYKVGCSIVQCPVVTIKDKEPWMKAVIFACDYNPSGNQMGRKPYTKGTPCSRCPTVARQGYYCANNLCYECNPTKRKHCTCIPRKCVYGTWKKDLCKCQCQKGYWGLTCKEQCVCKDVFSTCVLVRNSCLNRGWYDWLSKRCSATCPNACPKPPKRACR